MTIKVFPSEILENYFKYRPEGTQSLLIAHCQLSILVQKNALHPAFGTKGKPSAVPPAFAALAARSSDADTPQTDNGVTRPALLLFQAAAPGRKPVCCTYGAPTVPRSLKCKPTKGSPIAAFDCYGGIISPEFSICKYFLKKPGAIA